MTSSPNKTFLGIGECMIELSQAGSNETGLLRQSFAGDVFNTLWYFQQLAPNDWHPGFLSAVGDDPMSAKLRDFIGEAGISDTFVRSVSGKRPGLYMIHLKEGERSFSYWRESSAARLLASDPAYLARAFDTADALYLSGITLAILSPEHLENLVKALKVSKDAGKFIAFDPNIRPALWDDPNRMRAEIMRAAGLATIVLPGFDDEAAHFADTKPEDTISRYLQCGAQSVVLKNGSKEILVGNVNATERYDTPVVKEVVDTTAAGDSFNGAFLADYLVNRDFISAVASGQKCAGEVIQKHGALIHLQSK